MKLLLKKLFLLLPLLAFPVWLGAMDDGCRASVKQYARLKRARIDKKAKTDSLFLLLYRMDYSCSRQIDSLALDFIRIAKQQPDNYQLGKAHLVYGMLLFDRGQNERSKYYCEKAIKWLKKEKPGIDFCYAHQILSGVHTNMGHWDEAIRVEKKALRLATQLNNKVLQANSLNQIGFLYNLKGMYGKARDYFVRAHRLRIATGDIPGRIATETNLGNVYTRLNQPDRALIHLTKAIDLAKRHKDDWGLAAAYNDLGALYLQTGKYALAHETLNKCIRLREEIGEVTEIGFTHNYLATVYRKTGDFNLSLQQSRIALAYALDSKNKKLEHESYLSIAQTYAAQQRYDSAFFYNERHHILKDSLEQVSNLTAVQSLATAYTTSRKEKQIALLRKQAAIHRLHIDNQQLVIRTTSGIVLLLIIVALLLWRSRRLRLEKLRVESELNEERLRREAEDRLQADRQRISKELHDNIGASLTFIRSSVIDKSQSEEEIAALTEETIRELRKSVWLLNHPETTVETWVAKLRDYFRFAPMVTIEHTVATDQQLLRSSMLTGLFRFVQEAVNNALKHAACTSVHIHIEQTKQHLLISVSDNGKGFDPEQQAVGFGIKNMRGRVQEAGGSFTLQTEPGKGTTLTCLCLWNETTEQHA